MQDDISYFNTMGLLDLLLVDKTTGTNVLWATDDYQSYGEGFHAKDTMSQDALLSHPQILQPRKQKAIEHQSARTREHAEVFTPSWMCRKMNDIADAELKASFPEGNAYIKARVLEITCGEAPFLTSRYDVVSGEAIPVEKRTGLLDRKLMVVDRLATDENDWMPLALCALQSTYGYEWQGDSLLLARINIARSFSDHLEHTWGRQPTLAEWRKVLHVIAWNVWQMDGLTGTIPLSEPEPVDGQLDLFAMPERKSTTPLCRTYDWRSNRSVVYSGKGSRHMKFDFIIGNPPYNEDFENSGDNGKFAKPIYNDFMDEAYQIADKVELIHPARFLFNAGSTPKEWNQKMLNDPHFKILQYEPDSAKVFPPPVDIKGGWLFLYTIKK